MLNFVIVAPVALLVMSWVVQSALPPRAYLYRPSVVTGTADVFYRRAETRLVVVADDGDRIAAYCGVFDRWNGCMRRLFQSDIVSGDRVSVLLLKPKFVPLANNVVIGVKIHDRQLMSVDERAVELEISCDNLDRRLPSVGWGSLGGLEQCQ